MSSDAERSRTVSEAEVGAAALALYARRTLGGSGYAPNHWEPRARAALEAAAKARAQGESEHASHEFCDPTLGCVEGGTGGADV